MPNSPSQSHIEFLKGVADFGNPNFYALYKPAGQPKYRPLKGTVSEAVIIRHLVSETAIGCYFVLGSVTHVGVIDCDDHDGTMEWSDMVAAAQPLVKKLSDYGIKTVCFRSGGGAGLHIWMFWEIAQPAALVMEFLKSVAKKCGFKHGAAGGILNGVVEVFPKNREVKPDAHGNLIALPLARKSVPLDDNLQPIPMEIYKPPSLSDLFSPEVADVFKAPEPKSKQRSKHSKKMQFGLPNQYPAGALPGDEDEVAAALRYLDADDYETWIKFGLATKYSLGDAGFPTWDKWSSKSANYPGSDECQRVWDTLLPDGTVTIGTIFHLAQERGWDGPKHAVVRDMNARFGIWTHGSKTAIIVKRPLSGETLTILGKGAFLDRMAPEKFAVLNDAGETKQVPKGNYWLKHQHASHIHQVIFDPDQAPGQNGYTWNMWQGFNCEPMQGDWSRLQHHIYHNICGGNDQIYEWMLNWMALGIQEPGLVIGTAPVLRGMPGTGKGFLANIYGHLWGVHYVSITKDDHVSGRFNQHLEARRFVYVDEAMFGGDRKNAGVIKTMLTEPRIMIERKGIDPVFLDNHMIFMVTSNEQSVVPADIGDRRWQVLEVSDAHRDNKPYFSAIARQMQSGGYEAMMYDLLKRDVSKGPDPRKTIPTPELFEQIVQAQGPVERYLYQILDDGYLPQPEAPGNGAGVTTIAALMADMNRSQPNAKYVHEALFGKRISKVIPGIGRVQSGLFIEGRDAMGQLITGRSTRYSFPPLQNCRRAFEAYVGQEVPWSNDLIDWQADLDPGYDYWEPSKDDPEKPF